MTDALMPVGIAEIPVSSVVFREDLYPRLKTSPETVQKYAEDLSVLPAIEVNQHNELIDGWHRWTAHKKAGADTIRVLVIETASDVQLLELAIERNATHGLQLSQEDKRDMARRIYHATPERERDAKKKELARILSVGERTVREWLSRIDKDMRELRDRRIREMWMACGTDKEIGESVDLTEEAVRKITQEAADLPKVGKSERATAEHAIDFDVPLYNVWKQQEKTSGSSHFGNSEVRWVDNLLYLYTKPFDVVVDPFAGGGSTIDLCRKRMRRYWVSDRKPIVEREKDIRKHDLTDGVPRLPWRDVSLVYLDPPYWIQAAGQYSDDATDLGNMTIDAFTTALADIVKAFAAKMKASAREAPAHIALIIQPTQWKAPERRFTDHVGDMMRAVKLPVDMRFSVPYESQQCTAQMVDWAKDNRRCLVLTREIIVWRVE